MNKLSTPTKNTDPKKLDASNIGDGLVVKMQNGDTRSVTLLTMFASGERAVIGWRTSPRQSVSETIFKHEWEAGRVLAIFPTGVKFLALEPAT